MDLLLSVYLQEVLFLQVCLVVQAVQVVLGFQVHQIFQLYLVGPVVLEVQEDLPSLFLLSNLLVLGDLSNQVLLELLAFQFLLACQLGLHFQVFQVVRCVLEDLSLQHYQYFQLGQVFLGVLVVRLDKLFCKAQVV